MDVHRYQPFGYKKCIRQEDNQWWKPFCTLQCHSHRWFLWNTQNETCVFSLIHWMSLAVCTPLAWLNWSINENDNPSNAVSHPLRRWTTTGNWKSVPIKMSLQDPMELRKPASFPPIINIGRRVCLRITKHNITTNGMLDMDCLTAAFQIHPITDRFLPFLNSWRRYSQHNSVTNCWAL